MNYRRGHVMAIRRLRADAGPNGRRDKPGDDNLLTGWPPSTTSPQPQDRISFLCDRPWYIPDEIREEDETNVGRTSVAAGVAADYAGAPHGFSNKPCRSGVGLMAFRRSGMPYMR